MTPYEKFIRRRDFLETWATGAALAGFAIVPRHVLGGRGNVPPSETVNIACIGVGNRGWTVIRQMEAHNIVAICDVDTKSKREDCPLPAPPVLDGMALTDSGVFVSMKDGSLTCLRSELPDTNAEYFQPEAGKER